MFKERLLKTILSELVCIKQQTMSSAQQAYDTATNAENKAENKYDTLGLEAAYLAEGQSLRVLQNERDIKAYELIKPECFSNGQPVRIGALITLLDEQGSTTVLFLGPSSGGLSVRFADQNEELNVKVITPSSPIGSVLLGKVEGEEVKLHIGHNTVTYEIMAVV